jgi:predicted O-methyltransferase YrrM
MERGFEMLFLGGAHHEAPEGEGRWRRCRQTYNNHALLFSRDGALKALGILGQWNRVWSDRELQSAMAAGRIRAWCVQPWVAYQRETKSDNFGNTDCVTIAEGARPMMSGDDLAVLDAALNFCRTVVEYGSGGSTVHLGMRLKGWGRLVSVEHNRRWYDRVKSVLTELDLPVTYLLSEPKPLREGDGPWRYLPGQMDGYVKAPRGSVNDGEVDLVFVDGRERIRCALEAAALLKPGGLLMIHDFWPRLRYRARLSELLAYYDYLFEAPGIEGKDPQGMAVFQRRSQSRLPS